MFGRKKPKKQVREHTPGEVRYDPKWALRKSGELKPAMTMLPKTPTRQLRRQMGRRLAKQPYGLPQNLWHDEQGFPKIIAAHKRRGGKATANKRIVSVVTKLVKGVMREVQLHATKGYRRYRA